MWRKPSGSGCSIKRITRITNTSPGGGKASKPGRATRTRELSSATTPALSSTRPTRGWGAWPTPTTTGITQVKGGIPTDPCALGWDGIPLPPAVESQRQQLLFQELCLGAWPWFSSVSAPGAACAIGNPQSTGIPGVGRMNCELIRVNNRGAWGAGSWSRASQHRELAQGAR